MAKGHYDYAGNYNPMEAKLPLGYNYLANIREK